MLVYKERADVIQNAASNKRVATSCSYFKQPMVEQVLLGLDFIFTTNVFAYYNLRKKTDKIILVSCSLPIGDLILSADTVRFHDLEVLKKNSCLDDNIPEEIPEDWRPEEVLVVYDKYHPCATCLAKHRACDYPHILEDFQKNEYVNQQEPRHTSAIYRFLQTEVS